MEPVVINGQAYTYDSTFRPLPDGNGRYAGYTKPDGSIVSLALVNEEVLLRQFHVNAEGAMEVSAGAYASREHQTLYVDRNDSNGRLQGYMQDSSLSEEMVALTGELYDAVTENERIDQREVPFIEQVLGMVSRVPRNEVDVETVYRKSDGSRQTVITQADGNVGLFIMNEANGNRTTYVVNASAGGDLALLAIDNGSSSQRMNIPVAAAREAIAVATAINLDGVQSDQEARTVKAITEGLNSRMR